MIELNEFEKVYRQAWADAKRFMAEFTQSVEFFEQGTTDDYVRAINGLKAFLNDADELGIVDFVNVEMLPEPNFASWLMKTDEGHIGIGLLERQMKYWAKVGGMPVRAQKLRSIIHEIGHLRIGLCT